MCLLRRSIHLTRKWFAAPPSPLSSASFPPKLKHFEFTSRVLHFLSVSRPFALSWWDACRKLSWRLQISAEELNAAAQRSRFPSFHFLFLLIAIFKQVNLPKTFPSGVYLQLKRKTVVFGDGACRGCETAPAEAAELNIVFLLTVGWQILATPVML